MGPLRTLIGLVRDMSDEEDCCDSDVGSVADLEWDTWADACTLTFQGAVCAFPPEAAEIRLAVGSVRGNVPMSPVLQVTDKGVAMIPSVPDRHVQRTVRRSVGWGTYRV